MSILALIIVSALTYCIIYWAVALPLRLIVLVVAIGRLELQGIREFMATPRERVEWSRIDWPKISRPRFPRMTFLEWVKALLIFAALALVILIEIYGFK